MTSLIILAIGVGTAITVATLSIRRHEDIPVADPKKDEAGIRRVLSKFPRFAAFVDRRLDRTSAGGLLLTAAVGGIFLLALVAGWVFDNLDDEGLFARWDMAVAEWGAANATDMSTDMLNLITDLGGTAFVTVVTAVVAAYGWWRHRSFQVAAYMIAVSISQTLVNNGLKYMINRERPAISQLAGWAGSSFPSGHSAAAAATYAGVAFVLGLGLRFRSRALLGAIAVGLAMAVGATRALLGVHWLTDVIAGLAVGWACFLVVTLIFGGRIMKFGAPAEEAADKAAQAG